MTHVGFSLRISHEYNELISDYDYEHRFTENEHVWVGFKINSFYR